MGKGITMSICYVRKVDFKIHVVSASVLLLFLIIIFFININLHADFI